MTVLANDGISKAGEELLKKAGIEFLEAKVSQEHLINFINENKVDVLLVRSATKVRKDLIDACPGLKIVGRGGVGMDNIDVEYAIEKGLYVINTPNASSRSVAEMVFAHFFSLARFLHESNRLMPLEGDTHFKAMKKSFSNAVEVEGKTLGVIGFGGIGQEVVKIGISLGMKIKVLTRKPRTETIYLEFFDGKKVEFKIKFLIYPLSIDMDYQSVIKDIMLSHPCFYNGKQLSAMQKNKPFDLSCCSYNHEIYRCYRFDRNVNA